MNKVSLSEDTPSSAKPTCFVLMPISEPDGYVKGHFKHVFDDIVAPACDRAGFKALRPDQVKQSNLIHLDILQKLLEAPMAVCDLSSRNPNVLFELALRQAFDKPIALVQEVGTPSVFDISPFRYAEYRKERTYHEVLEDQASIAMAIKDTFDAHRSGKGVNSIVKLLALSKPASLPEINAPEASADIQQLILAEVSQLREELRTTRRDSIMARRVMRDNVSSEFTMVRGLVNEAERRIMTCKEPIEVHEANRMLQECRHNWMRLRENLPNLPSSEREMAREVELRLDMLDHRLREIQEAMRSKGKK